VFLADSSGNTVDEKLQLSDICLDMNGSCEQGQLGGRLIQPPVKYRQHPDSGE